MAAGMYSDGLPILFWFVSSATLRGSTHQEHIGRDLTSAYTFSASGRLALEQDVSDVEDTEKGRELLPSEAQILFKAL